MVVSILLFYMNFFVKLTILCKDGYNVFVNWVKIVIFVCPFLLWIFSTGFRWVRQWLVINQKRRAYTQRVEPKLACVKVQLPNEAFQEGWEPTSSSYQVLKAPGMDVLKISMSPLQEIADGVSIWEWSGAALDEGADALKWFSDYLGKPSRLVRFNAAFLMTVVNHFQKIYEQMSE